MMLDNDCDKIGIELQNKIIESLGLKNKDIDEVIITISKNNPIRIQINESI